MAERIGDPVTLALALEFFWVATEIPEAVQRGDGIATGTRLIELGERIGDKERIYEGHEHRLNSYSALADRVAVDVELDVLSTLVDELRQPAQRWHIGTIKTMLALMEGRFEEAERLIEQTVVLGQRIESWNAVVSQRMSLFILRREQGRLAELATTIRRSVREYPTLLRFACALAHLEAELGHEREARAALDALLALDLAREHRDAEWLFAVALLPDPCAALGDRRGAAQLYGLLEPLERLYTPAPIEASFGAVARALGVLAGTLERFDDAERHLEVAIDIERRMRAPVAGPCPARPRGRPRRTRRRRPGPPPPRRGAEDLSRAGHGDLGGAGERARWTMIAFGLLGPLEASVGGAPLRLGPP
jgi:eukaryotic-like serine/threonine-protein kinase